jgi:hypoxanthine-DNA glycosylase
LRKSALPPCVDVHTRVLVLGSLPGERSLAAQEYYAHPSNAFWWLIGEVLGESGLPQRPYEERMPRLLAHGLGLWDVIESASRKGSLDTAIRDAEHRDLTLFARSLPNLRVIAFNGKSAAERGRRQLGGSNPAGKPPWDLLDLPSSSAAHASLSRVDKLSIWKRLQAYLA